MMLANAALFIAITVPLLFSGHWITCFWAIQAAVLLWVALRLNNRRVLVAAHLLLALALGKFYMWDYYRNFPLQFSHLYYYQGFTAHLWERWLTMAVLLGIIAWFARRVQTSAAHLISSHRLTVRVLWGLFAVFLFVSLNFETSAFFYDYAANARFASFSVLWTLFAISLMVLGFRKRLRLLRTCSLGLFGLTILKVFAIDMAKVSTPFRIVSFIVLGIMLIGASFLYHRYKDLIPLDENH
jgi:uncharacterized membrane protein